MAGAYCKLYRCKWLADGSKTLSEMAAKLEAAATELREMEVAGIQIDVDVANDMAELYTDDVDAANKYGLVKVSED